MRRRALDLLFAMVRRLSSLSPSVCLSAVTPQCSANQSIDVDEDGAQDSDAD